MSSASEIQLLALQLPERSRLKLAEQLLRSVGPNMTSAEIPAEAERRNAEMENGEVRTLEETEFWRGITRI